MTTIWVTKTGEQIANKDLIFDSSSNLFIGDRKFAATFGDITTLEEDLLLIAASIFATDRACKRGEREDYQRRIEINIPITNIARIGHLQKQLERILRILSNDSWRITFRQVTGEIENNVYQSESIGQVLLFSGGLDSLAAAVDLAQSSQNVQLVSHVTKNTHTQQAQVDLVNLLQRNGHSFSHHQFFVSSKSTGSIIHDAEDSQRTRSFLFLTLASLVARRSQHYEVIYLAENGQMAIHLPLTAGRIGAFSTHTAHPDYLAEMQEFVAQILDVPIKIENPYVYKTKGEVIANVVRDFPHLLEISQSCWRNSHLPQGVTHCGECIPCFIRRIAIECHGLADPTSYKIDLWNKNIAKLPSDDIGRRNIFDLVEFIVKFDQGSVEEIMSEWPELYSPNLDSQQVIAMYKRFTSEAFSVFSRYPMMKSLLT